MRARVSLPSAPSVPPIFAGRVLAEGIERRRVRLAAAQETVTMKEGVGLDPIETASRDEIEALQLERLRWSLDHAYRNVAHYRAAFDRAGVHPGAVAALADLAAFPFLAKSDLREHYPFGLFAVPRESVVRIHASSGTTGKPTVVGYTRADIDLFAEVNARSLAMLGGEPGMMLHNALGYGLFTGGFGFHCGGERLGMTVVPVSGGMTERQLLLIGDL